MVLSWLASSDHDQKVLWSYPFLCWLLYPNRGLTASYFPWEAGERRIHPFLGLVGPNNKVGGRVNGASCEAEKNRSPRTKIACTGTSCVVPILVLSYKNMLTDSTVFVQRQEKDGHKKILRVELSNMDNWTPAQNMGECLTP